LTMLCSHLSSSGVASPEGRSDAEEGSVKLEQLLEPQNNEGKTPEMSSVTPLVSPRQGDILEWELGPYIPASPLKDFATGEIVGEARPSVVANSVQAGSSLKTTHPVQVKLSDREAEGAARAAGKSSLEARNLPTGGWTRFPS